MNIKKEFAAYDRLVKRDALALRSFKGGGQLLTPTSALYKKLVQKKNKKSK